MASARQIQKLELLLAQAENFNNAPSKSPEFTAWRDDVERTLQKVYGVHALELKQFNELTFSYHPGMWMLGEDYSPEIKAAFHKDLTIAKKKLAVLIGELIEEAQEPEEKLFSSGHGHNHVLSEVINNPVSAKYASAEPKATSTISRVFVSHAHKDAEYVEELIELLNRIGLTKKQIFCTSVKGYGVPLGANFLQEIKERVGDDVLVLFVLSSNFYASPVCMAEMGAAWVLSKDHIPLVIPPFSFQDIKGVLPHTQGMMINDALTINELAELIQGIFGLKSYTEDDDWERIRNRIIKRIDETIAKDTTAAIKQPANTRAKVKTFTNRHDAI
jgi:hypothetical protein